MNNFKFLRYIIFAFLSTLFILFTIESSKYINYELAQPTQKEELFEKILIVDEENNDKNFLLEDSEIAASDKTKRFSFLENKNDLKVNLKRRKRHTDTFIEDMDGTFYALNVTGINNFIPIRNYTYFLKNIPKKFDNKTMYDTTCRKINSFIFVSDTNLKLDKKSLNALIKRYGLTEYVYSTVEKEFFKNYNIETSQNANKVNTEYPHLNFYPKRYDDCKYDNGDFKKNTNDLYYKTYCYDTILEGYLPFMYNKTNFIPFKTKADIRMSFISQILSYKLYFPTDFKEIILEFREIYINEMLKLCSEKIKSDNKKEENDKYTFYVEKIKSKMIESLNNIRQDTFVLLPTACNIIYLTNENKTFSEEKNQNNPNEFINDDHFKTLTVLISDNIFENEDTKYYEIGRSHTSICNINSENYYQINSTVTINENYDVNNLLTKNNFLNNNNLGTKFIILQHQLINEAQESDDESPTNYIEDNNKAEKLQILETATFSDLNTQSNLNNRFDNTVETVTYPDFSNESDKIVETVTYQDLYTQSDDKDASAKSVKLNKNNSKNYDTVEDDETNYAIDLNLNNPSKAPDSLLLSKKLIFLLPLKFLLQYCLSIFNRLN